MKRPAFQFYPADWRKDAALQSCSVGARGVWHELICIMHECTPYGHLAINGKAIEPAAAARLVGCDIQEMNLALKELGGADVYSVTAEGIIFSRRMVKDEALRKVRAECGSLGGNPILLNQKVNGEDNQTDNQTPTPSSSSSSSSSEEHSLALTGEPKPAVKVKRKMNGHARGERLSAQWRIPDEWVDWAIAAYHADRVKVIRLSLEFRDYWTAVPGQKGVKLDWFATWRNRCRQVFEK